MTKRASDSQDLISNLYSNWTLRIGRFQHRSHSTISQYPEQRYLFLFPFNRPSKLVLLVNSTFSDHLRKLPILSRISVGRPYFGTYHRWFQSFYLFDCRDFCFFLWIYLFMK